jgi:hypothetical protein
MIRRQGSTELMPWLDRARQSLVASFTNSVTKDEAARVFCWLSFPNLKISREQRDASSK